MIRRLLIAFLPFAPTTLAMGAAAQGQEPSHPPELVALATELRQWQRDPTSPSRWRNENEIFPSFANVFTA